MECPVSYIAAYLIFANLFAAGLVLYDKRAARKGSWRVRERTFLIAAAIGGSIAMLLMMRLIRHKTRHAKFSVGVPVIIVAQIAIVLFVWRRLSGAI